MDSFTKKSLHTNTDHQERRHIQSPPPHLTIKTHQPPHDQILHMITPSPPSSPRSLWPPPSPESPWALSPLRVPPPPPLQNYFSLPYHCLASLHRQEGNVYSIAVSKGVIFTGSESKRIRAWKQPDCTERGYLKSSSGQVRTILAYNNTLFTSHKDCKIRIWNFTVSADNFQAKRVSTLPKKSYFPFTNRTANYTHQHRHKDSISCMAYYQSEGILYTGSLDKMVKAWSVLDKKCVDTFVAHDGFVNAIVVNQEDGCVFTCSSDGSVKIWRRVYKESSHTLTMTLRFQQSPVNALALITLSSSFNNPNCSLYSGSSDGTINFWEKERFSSRFNHGGILQGHRFAVLCLVAIGRFLFSGSEDTTIRVWKRAEEGGCLHECVAVLDGHKGPVRCLAACLDVAEVVIGFLVYSAGLDQSFKVWKVKVIPDEDKDKMRLDYEDNRNNYSSVAEYEVSPVLSPSWVEKKLQGVSPFEFFQGD